MSKYYADTAIRIAKAEKGYIEKASNKDLNSKKANPGSNNYTKYGVITGTNGDYWCASYICWIMYKLCGSSKTTARKLLCGAFSASCETLRTAFVQKKRYYKKPAAGDLVFFSGTRHSGANHIGIVTKFVRNPMPQATAEYWDTAGRSMTRSRTAKHALKPNAVCTNQPIR